MIILFCFFKYIISGVFQKIIFFFLGSIIQINSVIGKMIMFISLIYIYSIRVIEFILLVRQKEGVFCVRDIFFKWLLLLFLFVLGLCCYWLLGLGGGVGWGEWVSNFIQLFDYIGFFFGVLCQIFCCYLSLKLLLYGMYKEFIYSLKII